MCTIVLTTLFMMKDGMTFKKVEYLSWADARVELRMLDRDRDTLTYSYKYVTYRSPFDCKAGPAW